MNKYSCSPRENFWTIPRCISTYKLESIYAHGTHPELKTDRFSGPCSQFRAIFPPYNGVELVLRKRNAVVKSVARYGRILHEFSMGRILGWRGGHAQHLYTELFVWARWLHIQH